MTIEAIRIPAGPFDPSGDTRAERAESILHAYYCGTLSARDCKRMLGAIGYDADLRCIIGAELECLDTVTDSYVRLSA